MKNIGLIIILMFSAIKCSSNHNNEESVFVMVASKSISSGSKLIDEDFLKVSVPKRLFIPSMLEFKDKTKYLGKIIHVNVDTHEFLYSRMFENKLLSQIKINPLGRLFPIKFKGLGYFENFKAGDHVDVIAVVPIKENDGDIKMVSKTILQNNIVAKTFKECNKSSGCFSTISMVLLPKDCNKIFLAQKVGSVALTKRNKKDSSLLKNTTTDVNKIIEKKRPQYKFQNRTAILKQIKILKTAPEPDPEPDPIPDGKKSNNSSSSGSIRVR